MPQHALDFTTLRTLWLKSTKREIKRTYQIYHGRVHFVTLGITLGGGGGWVGGVVSLQVRVVMRWVARLAVGGWRWVVGGTVGGEVRWCGGWYPSTHLLATDYDFLNQCDQHGIVEELGAQKVIQR